MTFFFLLFYVLYTYSPILTVLFDIDNRRLFTESSPESACIYVFISTLGLIGFSLPYLIKAPETRVEKHSISIKKQQFSLYSIFFVLLATIGEVINIFRAGGIGILASGKAVYQAKTGDLLITLPSTFFLQVSFFFLGLRLYISYEDNIIKAFRNKLFVFIVLLSLPLIIIYLSIGFRSPLLGIIIAFIMGLGYFISVKKIKKKTVIWVFIGYSLMAILFGIRGQLRLLFTTGNWETFNEYVIKQKTFLYYYNPANNEFGAPYGNYVKFYNDKDKKLLYGSSYLSGFLIPIPRFLLPFKKPQSISYKFRDRYFSEYKKTSRIAGSGFSYVMEAQWNFGIFGSFFIYFLTGSFFWFLEYLRNKNLFIYIFPLFYATFLPFTQSIHRSSFGYVVSNVIMLLFGILLLVIIRKLIPYKK